jgi:hypothetical protein
VNKTPEKIDCSGTNQNPAENKTLAYQTKHHRFGMILKHPKKNLAKLTKVKNYPIKFDGEKTP